MPYLTRIWQYLRYTRIAKTFVISISGETL